MLDNDKDLNVTEDVVDYEEVQENVNGESSQPSKKGFSLKNLDLKNLPKERLITIGVITLLVVLVGSSFFGKRFYSMAKNKTAIKLLSDGEFSNSEVKYNFFKDTIDVSLIAEGLNISDTIEELREEIRDDVPMAINEAREKIMETQTTVNLYGAVSDIRILFCSGFIDAEGNVKNKEELIIIDKDGIDFTKASGLDLEFDF